MTCEEFLTEMRDVLQTDTELNLDMVLGDLEEWDSLSIMATMAFIDKNFGVKLRVADIKAMKTIGDLAKKAGI